MGNSSYKKTRDAYTVLLEKIVDASLRLGLELNLQQQSALAMLLEGAAYKDVAQSLNLSQSYAVQITQDAVKELGLFLDRLESIEKVKEESEKRVERERQYYTKRILELQDEIAALKKEVQEKGNEIMHLPIHQLPLSPVLMSILLKAGYYTLDDVTKEDQDALKALPGMTNDMLRTIRKLIELRKTMGQRNVP